MLAGATLPIVAGLADSEGPLPHRNDLTLEDRARVDAVTRPTTDFDKAEGFEARSAGAGTSLKYVNRDAFSNSLANLSFEQERDFKLGNGIFKKLWVSSPSSTRASDGLGPLFNARSCQRCHLKDGRGHPPANNEVDAVSMFLRLSIPPQSEADRQALAEKRLLRIPEPTYGGQLQNFALPGIAPEGRMVIDYEERPVTLADGTLVSLRKPSYSVADTGYGPLHPDVRLSPRVAPQMIGLGLVEAIHPGDILAWADPEDANGDGISGKPSWVGHDDEGQPLLGRFGWKASTPTLKAQSADAFAGDIGISTPGNEPYGDCTEAQSLCRQAPHGEQAELGVSEAPDPLLDLVAFYSGNLAVPARRQVEDPQVLGGKRLFYEAGCAACHRPKYVTSRDVDQDQHAFQLIWPYSDFLLHDMGEGLADGRPVGDAGGREWRTAPLWGIGLTEEVSGHSFFLHDGRARSVLEAILWHGGEAEAAKDAVVSMTAEERDALLAFLKSL
ncbi:MAG: di-heme oxidoredictase family protein [Kiloniellales bacterium]